MTPSKKSYLITFYYLVPGTPAERVGKGVGVEPNLPKCDDERRDSATLPLGTREKQPLSWESGEAETRLMMSSRDLYRVVMGVEKPAMGQGGARKKGQ